IRLCRTISDHLSDDLTKHHQSIIRIVIPGFSKTDPDTVVVIATGGKYLSRDDGNIMFHRLGAKFETIYLFIQVHPEHESSVRPGYLGVFWKIINDRLHIA